MSKVRLHHLDNGRTFVVDEDYGEILGECGKDGKVVYVPKIDKRDEPFVQFEQNDLKVLVTKVTTFGEWQLLIYLLGVMDFENWISVSQAQMAAELKMKAPNFAKVLRRLLEKGIVHRVTNETRTRQLRVDPSVAWKGGLNNQKKAIETVLSQNKLPHLQLAMA